MGQGHTECEFGTGNALLRYGIDTRCSKQPPVVRDAFSEALGVKNRLLPYIAASIHNEAMLSGAWTSMAQ